MKDLVEKFFDEKIRITFKSKTRVAIEHNVLDPLNFHQFCLTNFNFYKDFIKESDVWQWTDKDKSQWILKVWELYFAESRKRLTSASDVFDGSNINTGDFELVTDFHTGKLIVYNSKQRFISNLHPDAFRSAMGKTQRAIIMEAGIRIGTFSFNPYNDFERRIIQLEGQEVVEFNCFHAPTWRCDDKGNLDLALEAKYANINPPQDFLDFMEHLVPNEEHRNGVYSWMYNAIYFRNETYLVLNGKKGAGKNLLSDLIGSLVGEDYYKKVPIQFLDSGFNAVLDKARLILLDELKIENALHKNKLKNYINKMQNIEKKGIDADKPVETFNSYIINNNEITDMHLDWDDRRFSVPDLTYERLDQAWDSARIEAFVESFKDMEFLRAVGFWLRRKGLELGYSNFHTVKGERFWKIVHNSLTEWQRVIIDTALAGTVFCISVADLRGIYRKRVDSSKFPFKAQRIADWLSDYRHRGQHKIAEIDTSGDAEEAELRFNSIFRKEGAVEAVSSEHKIKINFDGEEASEEIEFTL